MLERLFGSRARAKILKLFLFNPESRYYIREVARNLNLQVNSARRELNNLQDFGLLVSGSEKKEVGGKKTKEQEKYFKVNKNFVLFEELRALIVKAQILYQKDFVKDLNRLGQVKLVVLTGLFVNNSFAPIDLLIVGRISKSNLARVISSLEKNLGREVNYTFMNTSEFKYRREITDVFLYNILENRKIVVVDELGVT